MDPVKFAVVREDPLLEVELVRRTGAREALVVASGGCTALTLAARFPSLAVTAFDLNPAQLTHLAAKAVAAARGDLAALNVGTDDRRGLNQRGAFEGAFRILRRFLEEYIAPPEALARFFTPSTPQAERVELASCWLESPGWPAAFATAFNDALLRYVFTRRALPLDLPSSLAAHLQAAFERGLLRPDAAQNPFLQHVLLGHYRAAPPYAVEPRRLEVALVAGSLPDVPYLERFGVVSLSNIFDAADDALVQQWATLLARHARPGTAVLVRQLHGARDLRRFFAPHFTFDVDTALDFLRRERSLLYERITVALRNDTPA